MKNEFGCYVKTPIGTIVIEEDGKAITALYISQDMENRQETENGEDIKTRQDVENKETNSAQFVYIETESEVCVKNVGIDCEMNCESELLQKAVKQMQEYFTGRRKEFELPIRLQGTDFQQKVWNALRQIPYGETRSYGEVAAIIGNPKASRAVGGANHKNPIMLIVPCHRVIGADGSLTGFGGGLRAKEYLLSLEKKYNV